MPYRIDSLHRASTSNLDAKEAELRPVVDTLAAIADRPGLSENAAKRLLLPATSKRQQLNICRRDLTSSDKADLVTLLDSKARPRDPALANFLEALIGRSSLHNDHVLMLKADKASLTGHASPQATLEGRNLSREVAAWHHARDGICFADADKKGHFSAPMPGARAGDYLQVRGCVPIIV